MTEKITVEWYKRLWRLAKSVFLLASNIAKILDNQAEIKERLDKIEEAIKSPQYRVAELEEIKLTVDLLKENKEQEIKRLKTGSQEEIAKHKTKIDELEKIITELSEYKLLILDAIKIIKTKNSEIKKLNEELDSLKKKAPSTLSELLGFTPPLSHSDLAEALFQRKLLEGREINKNII